MELGRATAWVFDGVLDVDWQMVAPDVAERTISKRQAGDKALAEEYAKYLMTPIDPDFPKKVRPGDYIVGGKGIGYGHDHTGPCIAMQGAGIGAVLCEATSTNFKRNCIYYGVPVVEAKGIMTGTSTGDDLEVDLGAGVVKNLTSGRSLQFRPYPDFMIEIIQAGGMYPLLKSRIATGEIPGGPEKGGV